MWDLTRIHELDVRIHDSSIQSRSGQMIGINADPDSQQCQKGASFSVFLKKCKVTGKQYIEIDKLVPNFV
jgi:hypothetical protein